MQTKHLPQNLQQVLHSMGKRKAANDSPAAAHTTDNLADADIADTKRARPDDTPNAKQAPVLQWMRVPMALQGSVALALQHVRGMDPRLTASLQQGTHMGDAAAQHNNLHHSRHPEPVSRASRAVAHHRRGRQCRARRLPQRPHWQRQDPCIPAPSAAGTAQVCCRKLPTAMYTPPHSTNTRTLGAVIVVPTKDLAKQVFRVLQQLCPATGLTAALVNGHLSEAQEAAALEQPMPAGPTTGSASHATTQALAHIMVATPGRLVKHLHAGLSLRSLKFLVADEVDRLMRQSYNEWLPLLLHAMHQDGSIALHTHNAPPRPLPAGRVVKLVASATITSDPAKLARLGLHAPRYVALSATDHRHALPATLKEFRVMCSDEEKGLVLLCLLKKMVGQQTIVFTASVDATHRYASVFRGFRPHALRQSVAAPVGVGVLWPAGSGVQQPPERRASCGQPAGLCGWRGAGAGVQRRDDTRDGRAGGCECHQLRRTGVCQDVCAPSGADGSCGATWAGGDTAQGQGALGGKLLASIHVW